MQYTNFKRSLASCIFCRSVNYVGEGLAETPPLFSVSLGRNPMPDDAGGGGAGRAGLGGGFRV